MPQPPEPRPLLHFAPQSGWINDPNGLLYLDGEYHLFYQHHPQGIVWGPMHWGHAVSTDLVRWQELPIALVPDAEGAIFSGSAVVDAQDRAGFGAAAMIAIFTQDRPGRQAQSLAWSHDHGRTWLVYPHNPVLTPPAGIVDFRDPKVFWYQGVTGSHWVMLLAVGLSIWFYRSDDLKQWVKTSEFSGYGMSQKVWETPDLHELPIAGTDETQWMLVVSVPEGAPAGGSGTQYFLGSFDGERFVCVDPPEVVRWADHGADFYAAQLWNDAPNQQHVWVAWMNNWNYANHTPATTWRGMMTLPRTLQLVREHDRVVLVQQPVALGATNTPSRWVDQAITVGQPFEFGRARVFDLTLQLNLAESQASSCELALRAGADSQVTLHYDCVSHELTIDRTLVFPDLPKAATRHGMLVAPRDGMLDLRIIVDTASVEIFADGGRLTLCDQIFPDPTADGLCLSANDGPLLVASAELLVIEA
ncbi:MAG: hypothetical protein Fur005_43560 [Roseiflexaceae bacterium]